VRISAWTLLSKAPASHPICPVFRTKHHILFLRLKTLLLVAIKLKISKKGYTYGNGIVNETSVRAALHLQYFITLVELSIVRIIRHGLHGYPYGYLCKWSKGADIHTDIHAPWPFTLISTRISVRMSVSNHPCYDQFDQGRR